MPSSFPQNLSFDLLDDVMFLDSEQREKALSEVKVTEIGPLIEYSIYSDSISSIDQSNPIVEAFDASKNGNLVSGIHSFFKSFEFTKGPQSEFDVEDSEWQSFLLRSQRAANAAGIEISMAKAISATIAEMAENIIWHSESVQSSTVGYQYCDGRFDYVVADAGIGILKSLKRSPEFSTLRTSTEALLLAVKNGVSRFSDSKRGTGFNSLVLNLAKRSCDVRFRSGKTSLTFEGVRPYKQSKPPEPVLRECADIRGVIISFTCIVPEA